MLRDLNSRSESRRASSPGTPKPVQRTDWCFVEPLVRVVIYAKNSPSEVEEDADILYSHRAIQLSNTTIDTIPALLPSALYIF